MKTNKNGVKLLAAIMVFAMAFAGVVVASEDSDAATTAPAGATTLTEGILTAGIQAGNYKLDTDITIDSNVTISNNVNIYGVNHKFILKAKIEVSGNVTVLFDGCVFENDSASADKQIELNQTTAANSKLVINNCSFTGSSTEAGYEVNTYEDRTIWVADGSAEINNTNFNGKKLTISYSADKVTIRNCSAVYINFGVSATFNPDSTESIPIVDIDSTTSIDGVKIENGKYIDLGKNTIVAKKLFVKDSGTIKNGTLTADIVPYEGQAQPDLIVSDIVLKGDNKLDSVKITVFESKKFQIDGQLEVTGAYATIDSSSGTFINNNTAPGSNLIPSSGSASGEGWSYENKTLTLDGYNGSNIFRNENIVNVILIGDNTITLDATADGTYAIESTGLKYIKTLATGNGSLSITITGDYAKSAIKSNADLEINGVSLSIDITNDADTTSAMTSVLAIDGTTAGSIKILFADVSISMNDTDGVFNALKATTVEITRSNVEISAPSVGIDTTNSNDSVFNKIAESSVKVDSGSDGIISFYTDITNGSTMVADSVSGYGFKGGFTLTQGSKVTVSGMDITQATANYAEVVNSGATVIRATAGSFTNYATFTNNGVIGVYGTFTNAGGETINNGEINTYGYTNGDAQDSKAFSDGTTNKTLSFTNPEVLADGTISLKVSIDGIINPLPGKMTVNGNKIVIKAVSEDATVNISVTFSKNVSEETTVGEIEKYTVTVSPDLNFNEKTTIAAETVTTNETNLLALKGLISNGPSQFVQITDGKLTNKGSISINTEHLTNNVLVKGGELVNSGEIIVKKNVNMDSGKLTGDAITVGAGVTITLKGTVDIPFSYAGEYIYEEDDKEKTETFDNTLNISGSCSSVIFKTIKGANGPGEAVFEIDQNQASTKKTITVTIVKGTAIAKGENTVFKNKGVTIDVQNGATFQASGKIVVGEGVLAAQDGSTINIKGEAVETYSYGELAYTISFAKDGYTYYGSIAYALANASEGMTLVLNKTTPAASIDDDLTVGKGITLQFAKNATLNVGSESKTITINMLEGASFVFTDKTNAISFTADAVITGSFVYDGNTVVFSGIAVKNGDGITCDPSTKSSVSDIKVAIGTALDNGSIAATAGKTVIGATFDDNAGEKTASKLIVSEGASVADNNALTLVLNAGASAIIDGSVTFYDDTTVSAIVSGTGSIIVSDGKYVIFDGDIAQNISVTNKDSTDKIVLKDTAANDKNATANTIKITSVAKAGTKAAYMDLSGKYYSGEIQIIGNGSISTVDVDTKATLTIPADSVVTVLTESKVSGLVKNAGTLNMKVDGDSSTISYAVLNYDITYVDGDYTVYTVVGTAVANASAGDSFTLTKNLEVTGKLTVPSGVTVIVPEEYKIVLGTDDYIVLGSGITTIGATGGIQGTVELSGNAYVIEFADASMDSSAMKIVSGETGKKIVDSQVTVLNQLYATAYAIENAATLANNVLKNVIPEIDGYRFVKFTSVVGGAVPEKVGDGDVIASMMASQVQVVFQKVDGITYYVNNVKQNTVGAPVYIAYGSTVTAVADYGYSGTPLVNGKAYITVDSTTTTIVGSGVSPTEPEPTPEPEKDDGMGITDYLLIVLVVLAAILVVIVAIRMMRS